MATTLTNKELQFAFRRIQMIGNRDLPIKVSYAMTRTKNKYLKSEVESFREEVEDLDPESDEFESHLEHEVETEVHNVSADHLRGGSFAPEIFVGLTFIFPETQEISQSKAELQNGEIVQAVNVLQRWSGQEMDQPETILQISHALSQLQSSLGEIQDRLDDFNQQIEDADDPEPIREKRTDFLSEYTEVMVSEIDVDALVENGVDVAPMELEAADPFLVE